MKILKQTEDIFDTGIYEEEATDHRIDFLTITIS